MSILRGISNCKPDDIIMISDVDEIPDPDIVSGLLHNKVDCLINEHFGIRSISRQIKRLESVYGENWYEINKSCRNILEYGPLVLNQKFYYYYMNCECNEPWYGTVVCLFKNISNPQLLRNQRNRLPFIKNAGWHFSYLGGKDRILEKLNAIVEGGLIKKNPLLSKGYSLDELVEYCIDNGIDLFGREGMDFKFIASSQIGLPADAFKHFSFVDLGLIKEKNR